MKCSLDDLQEGRYYRYHNIVGGCCNLYALNDSISSTAGQLKDGDVFLVIGIHPRRLKEESNTYEILAPKTLAFAYFSSEDEVHFAELLDEPT